MANNKDDYLTEYREFFEHFAKTVNPNEQLPVKLASYKFINHEVVGGIVDWTTQYLNGKGCPSHLLGPLIQIAIDEIRRNCKKDPIACGFNASENAYEPLKLMQSVILQVNDICLRYLDNSKLCSLPSPGAAHCPVSCHAIKNLRRGMEDRHTVVHDLTAIFNALAASPSSYYAIFDGHAGHDAAAYCAAHLHQFLAESAHFAARPHDALMDAFLKTDLLFIEKCKMENFISGTTAVCALLRPKEKSLLIAWVGDSVAVLCRKRVVQKCVNPHKPNRPDERSRIEAAGGVVNYFGTWRVNGQLAVSRAIGDALYKPVITAVPEIREYHLDGSEDFLILACDGLWDVFSETEVASFVYKEIGQNPDTIADTIAKRLVHEAKVCGSSDNISVIVVFLQDPRKIAAAAAADDEDVKMEASFDNASSPTTPATNNNPFANTNGADIQKDVFLLDLGLDAFRSDIYSAPATNGKTTTEGFNPVFDEDDDVGPETDVDAVDDAQTCSLSDELEEKVAKEIDANLMKAFDGVDTNLMAEQDDEDEELQKDAGVDIESDDEDEEEEEWNYIEGKEDKENVDPEKELFVALSPQAAVEDPDSMSQLNPNAEEFVPVSPTRALDPHVSATLKDDQILAQSPRRPIPNYDFHLPSNEEEFHADVKSRPSEADSVNFDNKQQTTSLELMENLLNGKNIAEIEFAPIMNTTTTTDEVEEKHEASTASSEQFLFGFNSAAFSTPSKHLDQSRSSTKATFGDTSTREDLDAAFVEGSNDLLSRLNREEDPMSMSFYQDKDQDDASPFDLNKVHILPDDELGDKSFNETTLSDPPLKDEVVETEEVVTNKINDEDVSNVIVVDAEMRQDEIVNLLSDEETQLLEEKVFPTDAEIVERPEEALAEVGVAMSPTIELKLSSEVICEGTEEKEEIPSPEPVICFASADAEVQYVEAVCEEKIEVQQVVDVELASQPFVIDASVNTVPVLLEAAVPTFDLNETVSACLPDQKVEQVEESQAPIEGEPLILDEKESEMKIESDIEFIAENKLSDDVEVAEERTPIDDITSSVKDESPMEENIPQMDSSPIACPAESPAIENVAIASKEKEIDENIVETAAKVAAAATLVTVGTGIVAKAKESPKTKPATAPIKKVPATAASKTAKTNASPRPVASKPLPKTSTSSAASKTTSVTNKPTSRLTASKPQVKPRVASATSTDKKLLSNGEVKPEVKSAPSTARKPAPVMPSTLKSVPKSGANKASAASPLKAPIKTTAAQLASSPKVKTGAVTTATKTTTTLRPIASTNNAKPGRTATVQTTAKPSNLKTTSAAAAAGTTATSKVTTANVAAKGRISSAPAKPRVPLSARTTLKGPDADKQNKENVNKLTASRTATSRITSITKNGISPKSASTTTKTTTNKKASVTAAKPSKKLEKVPNGVVAAAKEEVVGDLLVKDVSPVDAPLILDNSQMAAQTVAD